MVDRFDNKSGAPGADGLPDDQASRQIQIKMQANAEKAAAESRARDMYMGNQIIGSNDLGPIGSEADMFAQAAATDRMLESQKKDESFPVLVTGAREVQGYSAGRGFRDIQPGVRVGLDTLEDQGFLGVTDQNIIGKVVDLTGGKTEFSDVIYKAAINQAAYNQKAGIATSVEDILERWKKGGLPENLRKYVSGGGGSGSGGAFSSVNRVVSLTDEGTARQLLNRALSGYLGREATDVENKMFLRALNVQEKANPSVTRTKGFTDGSGNTTQSQTVERGFNQEDFATRFARSQEGYAEYQTATTYLDAFIDALESDSRVI